MKMQLFIGSIPWLTEMALDLLLWVVEIVLVVAYGAQVIVFVVILDLEREIVMLL